MPNARTQNNTIKRRISAIDIQNADVSIIVVAEWVHFLLEAETPF